jgi:hypothetical protein
MYRRSYQPLIMCLYFHSYRNKLYSHIGILGKLQYVKLINFYKIICIPTHTVQYCQKKIIPRQMYCCKRIFPLQFSLFFATISPVKNYINFTFYRLFVTHCGIHGVLEAIYHKVKRLTLYTIQYKKQPAISCVPVL